jgi:hypothetical protein
MTADQGSVQCGTLSLEQRLERLYEEMLALYNAHAQAHTLLCKAAKELGWPQPPTLPPMYNREDI